MRPLFVSAAFVFALSGLTAGAGGQQRPAPAAAVSAPVPAPDSAFLTQYCAGCHNDRVKAGALSLDRSDPAAVDGHGDVWEKVVRKLRTGMMPPDGVPKPPTASRAAFSGGPSMEPLRSRTNESPIGGRLLAGAVPLMVSSARTTVSPAGVE